MNSMWPVCLVEALESRQLLSAVAPKALPKPKPPPPPPPHPMPPPIINPNIIGLQPVQVRHAYGFDQTALTGAGQTIAIVDAFDDPNIQSDLQTFDTTLGIPAPPSFQVVSQRGDNILPFPDVGWAGEISLDVEWSHAIAPGANILLVEADSSAPADLDTAIDFARSVAGVSVVSMSFGGGENLGPIGPNNIDENAFFTTIPGHTGTTFVASAGDSSPALLASFPSASPNVLSVGGTTLNVNGINYAGETTWAGSQGGYSTAQPEPYFQQIAQDRGTRSTPDVAYNADPNSGVAVYDSFGAQSPIGVGGGLTGFEGWNPIGGTSAGAPQWAALIALADQERVASGLGTLDGATQTLPILYGLYSPPGTPGYTRYTSFFNDIIDPVNPNWGGFAFSGGGAVAGYDFTTGLGSPKAAAIISALQGSPPPGSFFSSQTIPSTAPVPPVNPTSLPTSQITGSILNTLPVVVHDGRTGSVSLRLTNDGTSAFSGPVNVSIYASVGSTVDANSILIRNVTRHISLPAPGSRVFTIPIQFPANLADGSYSIIATINQGGNSTAPVQTATSAPVWLVHNIVTLSATLNGGQPISVTPGASTTTSLTIQNQGDVNAVGALTIKFFASTDQALDASDTHLITLVRHILLAPGQSTTLSIHFPVPANLTRGTFNIIAQTRLAPVLAVNGTLSATAIAPTV